MSPSNIAVLLGRERVRSTHMYMYLLSSGMY
jgi:hypothetical protein